MVLDEDDGVPLIDEAVEQVVEAFNIAAMEADGGFFEVEVACAGVVLPLFGEGRPLASSLTSLRRWASPPERGG